MPYKNNSIKKFMPYLFVIVVLLWLPYKMRSKLNNRNTDTESTVSKMKETDTTKMVFIKGGTFMMGAEKTEYNEKPIHRVTVNSFYLDKSEVTQEEFEQLMRVNPSKFQYCPNCPVDQVSWYEAVLYSNARTKAEGSTDTVYSYQSMTGIPGKNCVLKDVQIDYQKNGYRLPTEAEWEYACRSGTTTPFSFGYNISPEQVNYNCKTNIHANGRINSYAVKQNQLFREKTVEVKSLPPNAWGLYEMHGNVWEWCNDWYGEYPEESVTDPKGPDSGEFRVLRGGAWNENYIRCRSATRSITYPHLGNNSGFRLCKSVKG